MHWGGNGLTVGMSQGSRWCSSTISALATFLFQIRDGDVWRRANVEMASYLMSMFDPARGDASLLLSAKERLEECLDVSDDRSKPQLLQISIDCFLLQNVLSHFVDCVCLSSCCADDKEKTLWVLA